MDLAATVLDEVCEKAKTLIPDTSPDTVAGNDVEAGTGIDALQNELCQLVISKVKDKVEEATKQINTRTGKEVSGLAKALNVHIRSLSTKVAPRIAKIIVHTPDQTQKFEQVSVKIERVLATFEKILFEDGIGGMVHVIITDQIQASVLGLGESGLGLPKVDQSDLVLEGEIPRVHAARTGGLWLVQAGVVNEGLVALLRMIPAERVVVDAALKNLKQRCNSAADLVHGGSRVVIRRKLVLDEGEVRSQKLDEASGLLQRSEGLPLVLGELASLLAILGDPTAPVGGEASMLG